MRLDFNVLWVDDQPDRVEAQVKAIAKQMEDEGFEFKPQLCESMDQVRTAIGADVFTDEVDLILVDWDLGGGVEGQNAIAEIRGAIQYKDVVFYSAQTAPDKLRSLAFEAGLEGIYCAARDGLVDEVVGVFDSLVKKVLDLDHTRGIVMGATSDIDHMVTECLVAIHEQLDVAGKSALLKDALVLIGQQIEKSTTRATKLQESATMEALFEAHMIFSAYDRLRVLSHALEMEALTAHSGARPAVVEYMGTVVPERNILGHKVLVPAGKPQVTNSQGNPISLDQTRELRRRILNLRNEFRNLLSALRPGS